MRRCCGTTAAWVLLGIPQLVCAVSVSPEEQSDARRWVAAKFMAAQETEPRGTGLTVLANYAPVQLNGRNGKPLQVGDDQYTRGLYCHAVSRVLVRLPGPGKTLSAIVGVDSNDQTIPGRGSIVFSVTVGDANAFQSGLMREGMPGVPVQVDLDGATEFLLEVDAGGDGIGCDQADWADAKVVLEDDRVVWLGDLPISVALRPYDTSPFFSFVYDGKPAAELLATWELKRSSRQIDPHRTEYTLTYADPESGLVVRCVGVAWKEYPTVEWTVYFTNEGATDMAHRKKSATLI